MAWIVVRYLFIDTASHPVRCARHVLVGLARSNIPKILQSIESLTASLE